MDLGFPARRGLGVSVTPLEFLWNTIIFLPTLQFVLYTTIVKWIRKEEAEKNPTRAQNNRLTPPVWTTSAYDSSGNCLLAPIYDLDLAWTMLARWLDCDHTGDWQIANQGGTRLFVSDLWQVCIMVSGHKDEWVDALAFSLCLRYWIAGCTLPGRC